MSNVCIHIYIYMPARLNAELHALQLERLHTLPRKIYTYIYFETSLRAIHTHTIVYIYTL